jgi:serine protease Do
MDEFENNMNEPQQAPSYGYYSFTPPTPQPPAESQKAKKDQTGLKLIALALCFSLLGGCIGAGGVILADRLMGQESGSSNTGSKNPNAGSTAILEGNRENTVIDINSIDTSKIMSAAEVYAANVGSTVGITTSITTNFWGYQTTSAASGSGFIISENGYILTNFHVIENSNSITVSLYNGENYDGKLIGYDESNDIAVLKIEADGLSPVVLGDSDNLNVGDSVVAIGNPLGELTFSLTSGAISAKGREVTFSGGITMNLLQTDCAINSGNSGGALFNLYGEVIGVTNAKYSSSSSSEASIDNIGFAIPINSIRSIVESIIEKGYVSKPYLGVSVSDVNESYQIYGLPAGAAIQAVAQDSPAEKAGLQIGDIITKSGDKDITCADDLVRLIGNSKANDTLTLTVYRKGQTVTVTVTIGEQIQSTTPGNNEPPSQRSGTSR